MAKTVKYPWVAWLRPKRPSVLRRGRDFRCAPYVMAQQIRNRANASGLRVSLLVGRDSVIINSVRRK